MTLVMGILNVTPDSFSDGGRFADSEAAIAHGLRLLDEGADIIDVGGESTRPGASRVAAEVEQERVLPVVSALAAAGATLSIDTLNADTAALAVAAGARIVNDVSGGLADPQLLDAVAGTSADVVLGHWRGPSADMYARADYRDIEREVATELSDRLSAAGAAGVPPARVILDPGIGFGKRGAQNWQVLRALDRFAGLGPRLLVGTSRKGFLTEALGAAASDHAGATDAAASGAAPSLARRDLATAVTSVLAAQRGAWAVRVHDVPSTRDALRVAEAWEGTWTP